MSLQRIILDTNVLYAGMYSSKGASHQVLKAIERNTVKLVLSVTLVFEYEDVLRRSRTLLGLSNPDIDKLLDDLCVRSEHQPVFFLWRPQLSDPKDDHLLELAVASPASVIVTHNTRDFIGVERFGVQLRTPRQLLEELP